MSLISNTEGKPMKIEFAYVYVIYYYNPYNYNRWHQFDPVVYSSMDGALSVVTNHTDEKLQTINDAKWRAGWYWIDRLAICDVADHGLEWESQIHDGKSERHSGFVPLKFT